jgi:hypothetical protein
VDGSGVTVLVFELIELLSQFSDQVVFFAALDLYGVSLRKDERVCILLFWT